MPNDKKITVTQPSLPELKEFIPYLEKIWESKWLTNNGPFHQQLETELAQFLGVKSVSPVRPLPACRRQGGSVFSLLNAKQRISLA